MRRAVRSNNRTSTTDIFYFTGMNGELKTGNRKEDALSTYSINLKRIDAGLDSTELVWFNGTIMYVVSTLNLFYNIKMRNREFCQRTDMILYCVI